MELEKIAAELAEAREGGSDGGEEEGGRRGWRQRRKDKQKW